MVFLWFGGTPMTIEIPIYVRQQPPAPGPAVQAPPLAARQHAWHAWHAAAGGAGARTVPGLVRLGPKSHGSGWVVWNIYRKALFSSWNHQLFGDIHCLFGIKGVVSRWQQAPSQESMRQCDTEHGRHGALWNMFFQHISSQLTLWCLGNWKELERIGKIQLTKSDFSEGWLNHQRVFLGWWVAWRPKRQVQKRMLAVGTIE